MNASIRFFIVYASLVILSVFTGGVPIDTPAGDVSGYSFGDVLGTRFLYNYSSGFNSNTEYPTHLKKTIRTKALQSESEHFCLVPAAFSVVVLTCNSCGCFTGCASQWYFSPANPDSHLRGPPSHIS